MASRNLENEIKEKLQKREIAPSAASWDKLEAKLNDQTKKNNKSWLLGIAAAVAVGVFVGSFAFFSGTESVQLTNVPIEENTNKTEKTKQTQIVSEEKLKVKTNLEPKNLQKQQKQNSKTAIISEVKQEGSTEKHPNQSETSLAENQKLDEPAQTKILEEIFQENKQNTLVANLEEETKPDLATEVDLLLSNAQDEIKAKALHRETLALSKDLLQEVESDLDRSFRNQVFEILKDGFSKVKVAVANKN